MQYAPPLSIIIHLLKRRQSQCIISNNESRTNTEKLMETTTFLSYAKEHKNQTLNNHPSLCLTKEINRKYKRMHCN